MNQEDFITLGRAHSDLFQIRNLANSLSLGRWLPECEHQRDVSEIARLADDLIRKLMVSYDKNRLEGVTVSGGGVVTKQEGVE